MKAEVIYFMQYLDAVNNKCVANIDNIIQIIINYLIQYIKRSHF